MPLKEFTIYISERGDMPPITWGPREKAPGLVRRAEQGGSMAQSLYGFPLLYKEARQGRGSPA